MGSETIHFNPGRIQDKIDLLRLENEELRNNNKLMMDERRNGMSGLLAGALGQFNITNFDPLFQANIASPISINYTFLTYFFKTHGIIQTIVQQPVQDALRGGVEITSDEMDEKNISQLQDFLEEEDILGGGVGIAECWARLFGGGCIVVNDGGQFDQPLKDNTPIKFLKFYPASRWELGAPHKLESGTEVVDTDDSPWEHGAAVGQDYYDYYGQKLHKSRVITMNGKEAPWMIRWMLQGWGMSEVERMIEDFNLYIRTRNVLYDLLNEAKVDVFLIEGMRETLLSAGGDQIMLRRIQMVQQAKNMNNALLLDKLDEYQQKQLSFTSIAEVMKENRMFIASAAKMPQSKLFGTPSSGFSSGEDDIENYNAMVESDVRAHIRKPIRRVIELCMRYLWGDVFQFKAHYKPLRVMSAKDEEDIRDKKFNRTVQAFDRRLMDSVEWGLAAKKDNSISVETKASEGKLDDFPETAEQQMQQSQMEFDKENPKESKETKPNGKE
jgi:uncharacterized protein